MIKSLLDPNEEPSPEIKQSAEEKAVNSPLTEDLSSMPEAENNSPTAEPENVFEIPGDARFFAKPAENQFEDEPDQPLAETEISMQKSANEEVPLNENLPDLEQADTLATAEIESENIEPENEETARTEASEPTIFQSHYTSETAGETVHNSGLAYSAAIVLFASIVFMMILGWFIGQLIGNSTGGIVGGIILGAIIGFVQFFRITSSIFKKEE